MIGFKKILFTIASLSLTVPVFSNLASCSKVSEVKNNDSVIKFQNSNISVQVGKLSKTLITNYNEIKDKGFLSNELIQIDDSSIVSVPYANGKINENLTFTGQKKGETKVHVTFVNVINQTQATGVVNVKVVSDVNVVYEDIAKENDKPLKFTSDKNEIDLGHITNSFWDSLNDEDKKNLSIHASNSKSNNPDINNFINFNIKADGHIIATGKQSVDKYELSTFHIKVVTTNEEKKLNDDGHDFWFEADAFHKDLHINTISPSPFPFVYNNDAIPRNPLTAKIVITVSNKEDWNSLTWNGKKSKKDLNDELKSIADNITTSEKGDDKILSDFNFDEVDPSTKEMTFALNFEATNRSFGQRTVNIPFKFSIESNSVASSDVTIAGNAKFTIQPFRHGAGIVDDHVDYKPNPGNYIQLDEYDDYYSSNLKTNYFDFTSDEGLGDVAMNGGLFSQFSFYADGMREKHYGEYVENLSYQDYKYDSTVTLTAESFNKLGGADGLNLRQEEDPDKISEFNKKIEAISRTNVETDYAQSTGIDLSAKISDYDKDFANSRLKVMCYGIKDDGSFEDHVHINQGEYYFLSKFKDGMGNYEVLWSHFEWKALDIQKNNLGVNLEYNIMSMPVSRDEQHKDGGEFDGQDNYNNLSSKDISNGVISKKNNATTASPLMLASKDITIGEPNEKGNFSDPDNPYRGFIKITGESRFDVHFSLESQTADIVDKDSIQTVIPDSDLDSAYLGFKIKGQGNKDVPQGEIKISMSKQGHQPVIITIPYAAYAGADSSAGKIDINNFIFKSALPDFVNPTSIYIAKSAKNREIYLGISPVIKSDIPDSNVANVYVESGYSYDGPDGAISTDLPQENRVKGQVPKSVGNITFGGDVSVNGSYVIYNTYGSGINGFVTFCGDVNFTSNNYYIGTDSNDQDPSQMTSAVIMTGSVRTDESTSNETTSLSKYGIRFAGNVNVKALNKNSGIDRSKERLAVIGLPLNVFTGNITFDGNVDMDYGDTKMREVGVYVYQDLLCDKNLNPNFQIQYLNMQKISGNLQIKGNDSKTPDKDLYRSLIIDKATSDFRIKSFDSSLVLDNSKFIVGDEAKEPDNVCSIASSYIESKGQRTANKFIVTNDWDSKSDISKSYAEKMPNVIINAKFINEESDDKNNVFALAASGRYAANSGDTLSISYYDNDNKKVTYTSAKWEEVYTFETPEFLK